MKMSQPTGKLPAASERPSEIHKACSWAPQHLVKEEIWSTWDCLIQ